MTIEDVLREKFEEANRHFVTRDMKLVDLFWAGGSFCLYGSEADEADETREELHRHVAAMFAKPYIVSFRFGKISADQHGDMAWANAQAVLEVTYPDRKVETPYRLFALFQQIGGVWHWRVFSGSEPAAPPA
ncbi:nuclear transport factor 2 family protein [Aestuariivirga litoralis]|uniref:nuclear transport factor 2 family protein n=1 Tax=Aestuariivirga litoralis TaxID=2650924 RepID=UPI0018C47891|nr:nuclear transport factor 2 family protein [Aestuariivirga litoralis]MBG1232196.1 nuclear transport factor 2 family protein [Aestuariivirga litoralis]